MVGKTLISFDYAIKYLLRDKGDYEIVEGFISALLESQGYPRVKIKAQLDSESNKESRYHKHSIADLIVEDDNGNQYIIEIDRQDNDIFLHKACFNSSRLIIDTLPRASDFTRIKKVLHISLLYFIPKEMQTPIYHGKTIFRGMVHENSHQKTVDMHLADLGGHIINIHNVFPEYFLISAPLFDDVIRREMDEWLYVVKNSAVKEDFKSPYMEKVKERLDNLMMTQEERDQYYQYMDEVLTTQNQIEVGTRKGKEEGKKEGIREGEKQATEKIAINMLKSGIDKQTVVEMTGLSLKIINTLVKVK